VTPIGAEQEQPQTQVDCAISFMATVVGKPADEARRLASSGVLPMMPV
jgi:hypothetical protein